MDVDCDDLDLEVDPSLETAGSSMISRMALNDNKAGMQGLDKERINKIIHENSVGSKFYENERKKDATVNERINKLLVQMQQITPEQMDAALGQTNKIIEELEGQRDLSKTIVHIDMDAFYASVEERDHPELKDKPMAVGGMGMLSTSNYIARRYGVRAAMPGFIGKKLCPELVLVSNEVREILKEYDPHFAPMGLDEAYLDITPYLERRKIMPESERTFRKGISKSDSGPDTSVVFGTSTDDVVQEIRFRIEQKTMLTASAGIAPNTLLAKVASDMNKPNGQFLLEFSRTIGMGSTVLGNDSERKSISTERTFQDISNPEMMFRKCEEICDALGEDVKRAGMQGNTVTLKIKLATFEMHTRSKTLLHPVSSKSEVYPIVTDLLRQELAVKKHMSLRLIGVGLSKLTKVGQTGQKQKSLEYFLTKSNQKIREDPKSKDTSEQLEIGERFMESHSCGKNSHSIEQLPFSNDSCDGTLNVNTDSPPEAGCSSSLSKVISMPDETKNISKGHPTNSCTVIPQSIRNFPSTREYLVHNNNTLLSNCGDSTSSFSLSINEAPDDVSESHCQDPQRIDNTAILPNMSIPEILSGQSGDSVTDEVNGLTTMTCPICNATFYVEDVTLAKFNDHLDSCLNHKTIKDLVQSEKQLYCSQTTSTSKKRKKQHKTPTPKRTKQPMTLDMYLSRYNFSKPILGMYGGNSNPPNMRFPPPPTFFRNPPYMNPNFPVGWPPVPPIIPQHHPPWMNANGGQAMIHQGRAGLHTERHLTPQSECMSHIADKKVKSLEKLDKEWIDDNLHRGCCSVKLQEQKGKSTTKISEVTRLHLKAYKLVQRLEQSCQSELSASASLTSADKKELDSILKLLEDENYVRGVSLSVLKREKKRKRIYLKKQEALKRKIDLEDNIKEKHLKTDKWLEDRRKVEDDWKRERKVRKDLDEYLSDIRQKQHSAKKYLQLFNAIAKLRKARCETADRKGQLQPSEAHKEVFVTAHESACIKLREFISECKNEENFMRKYLTEEHEAEERRIKDELEKEEKRKISNWKKERSKVLFESSNGDLDPSDPLWPVQEIHRQGTGSVIGLINIRAQWDQCIGDPGSTIPTPFVEPCLPSNDEWKNYLANS